MFAAVSLPAIHERGGGPEGYSDGIREVAKGGPEGYSDGIREVFVCYICRVMLRVRQDQSHKMPLDLRSFDLTDIYLSIYMDWSNHDKHYTTDR